MERTLSIQTTLVMKFVLPAVWIPGFGYATYVLWGEPANARSSTVHSAAGAIAERWLFLIAFLVGSGILLWVAKVLRRVVLSEAGLRVSDYFTEVLVPFDAVRAVSQNKLILWGMVRLDLVRDCGLGRTVQFFPRGGSRWAFWREDEVVSELRKRAGLLSR